MNDDMYLIILSAIIVILFMALIILTYKIFDLQNKISDTKKTDIQEKKQTQSTKKLPPEQKSPEPKRTIMPDINLTEGASDINESMKRYARKYTLDSATLASKDGFSLASSHADSEREAANLTARYQENGMTEIGDTHIIPLNYRGEELLILFRTTNKINPEQADMMRRDGGVILSKWL